jgi:acylphosphatase
VVGVVVSLAVYQIVSTSPNQRRDVLYSGRVQGVGFRYTVNRLARNYEVTGFVRNLPDGCVRLVVEGQADEMGRFLEDVARTMSGYIRDTTVDVVPATGQFGEFTIRF